MRARQSFDDRLEKPLAGAVEPVEILQKRHRRLAPTEHLRDALHHGVELALTIRRVHRRGGTLRIGNAKEIEDQRENLAQALIEGHKPYGDLFTRGLIGVLVRDTEEVPKELEHR